MTEGKSQRVQVRLRTRHHLMKAIAIAAEADDLDVVESLVEVVKSTCPAAELEAPLLKSAPPSSLWAALMKMTLAEYQEHDPETHY